MKMSIIMIAKGAESNLYKKEHEEILIKERIQKKYRIKEIDEKIRKRRTKSEVKILRKLENFANVPKVIDVDEKNFRFSMEYIHGTLLKNFDFKNDVKYKDYGIKLGREIAKIHKMEIVHNDLTTSNIIIKDTGIKIPSISPPSFADGEIYVIDFGLAFFSKRVEDFATDLIVLKHSLIVTNLDFLFEYVLKGYSEIKENFDEIFDRMKKVEKRVRYFSDE